MNSKLDILKKQLGHAFEKFQDALQQPKDEYMRDSSIQRFEFTYELTWKTMKAYLAESGIRAFSPKDAIKGAFQNGLIDEDPKWLEMIETRNLTTHIYNEDMAEKVYASLPSYIPLITDLIKNLG